MVDHISYPAKTDVLNSTLSHRVGHDKNVADIYNQANDDYITYADGDPTQPFAFDGLHAYADRCVWAFLERKLAELRASCASAVSFLDAGCGPGTWLRRLVIRARALGLAGLSVGYAVAPKALAASLKRAGIGTPETLNRSATSLRDENYVTATRAKVIAEHDKWKQLFDALKLRHSDAKGNFVFFETGRLHHEVAGRFLQKASRPVVHFRPSTAGYASPSAYPRKIRWHEPPSPSC
jgi:SAM-dependent methyltransferase